MLSVKQGGINTIFWVFSMTWPGTEPISLAVGEVVLLNPNMGVDKGVSYHSQENEFKSYLMPKSSR